MRATQSLESIACALDVSGERSWVASRRCFVERRVGRCNPMRSEEDKVGAAFQEYKFLVGFNNKFYIYWYNDKLDTLIFDDFEEHHCLQK